MSQIISAKKSRYLSAYLVLTITFLATLACSHNTSSNFKEESEEFEPEIVLVRDPNIIIQPSYTELPMTFAWLPESIRAYYNTGLQDPAVQKTIQEAITESLIGNGYVYDRETMINRRKERTNIRPEDRIVVKDWEWAGPGFGAGGFLEEITLDNMGSQDVRDLKIRIDYLGTKGAKEGIRGPTSIFVIDDLLPAKSEKTFEGINVGFRHPDAKGESIRVLNAKTIIDDLLIGYTLVFENTLNDQDINRAHNITAPSGKNDGINEYKRGTVIIDVIDAGTYRLVWRGAVQALESFDIPEDAKLNRIGSAVKELVNSFVMSNQ